MYFASKADSIVKQTLKQRQVHWTGTMDETAGQPATKAIPYVEKVVAEAGNLTRSDVRERRQEARTNETTDKRQMKENGGCHNSLQIC